MLPNQFPPSQCSSYFTQWLISEYLTRINESKGEESSAPSSPPQQQPPPAPPPPTPPPTPHHHHFKHLKHLFHTKHERTRNNNEYKAMEAAISSPKNIEFIQLLALNALEFTAPIYSFLNKSASSASGSSGESSSNTSSSSNTPTTPTCKCPSTRTFVQLSGHPGSFAPAGPNTVWKKMPEDQGGSCGRDQLAGKSLRNLLEGLHIDADPQQPRGDNSSSTTPITVFFNDVSTTTTTSTSSTGSTTTNTNNAPLLPPQVFSIPTNLLPNETRVYRNVNSTSPPDPLLRIIPKYVTETCYCSQMFLELEDLLTNFDSNPTIMDIKLGTRTFLESEVRNTKPRPDLYEKLISVDPTYPSELEHASKAVTKLTYMLFRENQSSSSSLGFRVEAVKISNNKVYVESKDNVNFKTMRDEIPISQVFKSFCKGNVTLGSKFLRRLIEVRECLEGSEFFMTHEVIGSSLLFIHDDKTVGVWLIDFAKTFPANRRLNHRAQWDAENMNQEDGVLTGIDNIVRLFTNLVENLAEGTYV